MNKLTIIGNLTRTPEMRTTQSGKNVCNFTVAVNNRRRSVQNGQPEVDFFRVQAWDKLAENCQRYLDKGRKVCVMGPVSVETYTANNGETRANMNVLAQDVEFLSSQFEGSQQHAAPAQYNYPGAHSQPAPTEPGSGYEEVEDDDLPF